MNNSVNAMQPLDTLPWYRQFWPWFIFSLPAAVVVAGILTIVIASRHADDLVVRDYYKTGLAINQQLEKREQALSAGMAAQFAIGVEEVAVRFTGPATHQVLTLRLSHPLEADRDFEVLLSREQGGLYRATLEQPIAPRWHWIIEAPHDSEWRLDGVLRATDFLR